MEEIEREVEGERDGWTKRVGGRERESGREGGTERGDERVGEPGSESVL